MHYKQKELLDKFDNWIEEEGLNHYDVVFELLMRAKERAGKLYHIEKYDEHPPEDLVLDEQVSCDMGGNLVGLHYVHRRFLKEYDFFLKKEEPDYQSILDEFLDSRKKIKLEKRNSEKRRLIFELKNLDLSEEEILEELRRDSIPF